MAFNLFVKLGLKSKDFDDGLKRSVSGTDSLKNSLRNLKRIALTVFVGWGIKKISSSFLDAAKVSEGFQTRLKALLGGVKQGNALFKAMADFAGRVPFEYREIMSTATQLAGVMKGGVNEIKTWMPMITDLAAVTGLSLEETTGQVIRMYSAGAAAADMFRERGILAMMGFKAGVSYSVEETRKMMFEAWNKTDSKFKDVTYDLADNWSGLMSMFSDAWFQFRNAVMDSGPFQALKDYAQELLNTVNRLKKEGKLDEWARLSAIAILDVFQAVLTVTRKFSDLLAQDRQDISNFMAKLHEMRVKTLEMRGTLQAMFTDGSVAVGEFGGEVKYVSKEIWDMIVAERQAAQIWRELADDAKDSGENLNDVFTNLIEKLKNAKTATNDLKDSFEDAAEASKEIVYEPDVKGTEKFAKWYYNNLQKINKARREQAEDEKKDAKDKLDAYRDMYSDMSGFSQEYYDIQSQLLQKQYDEYIRLTGDTVTATEWLKQKQIELWTESAQKSNDFIEGLKAGLHDALTEIESFGKLGYDLFYDFATDSKDAITEELFLQITGDGSYDWDKFFEDAWRKTLNNVLRMIVDWIAKVIAEYIEMETTIAAMEWASTAFAWLWGETGIWDVDKDDGATPAMLHPGEMVVPEKTARKIRETVSPGDYDSIIRLYGDIVPPNQMTDTQIAEWSVFAKAFMDHMGPLTAQGLYYWADNAIDLSDLVSGLAQASVFSSVFGAVPEYLGYHFGYSSNTANWGANILGLVGGIFGGPAGYAMGKFFGAVLGEELGDLFNIRKDETTLDAYEEWMSRKESKDRLRQWYDYLNETGIWHGTPAQYWPGNVDMPGLENNQEAWGGTPEQSWPSFETGTGLSGLPETGLFYGHEGEIVLNKKDSDVVRSGDSGTHIHLHLHNGVLASQNAQTWLSEAIRSINRNRIGDPISIKSITSAGIN